MRRTARAPAGGLCLPRAGVHGSPVQVPPQDQGGVCSWHVACFGHARMQMRLGGGALFRFFPSLIKVTGRGVLCSLWRIEPLGRSSVGDSQASG